MEYRDIIANHGKWLRGEDGGIQADLTGAILKVANLKGADLSYANLTGADLTGAKFTDANLTGADLTGVIMWSVKK